MRTMIRRFFAVASVACAFACGGNNNSLFDNVDGAIGGDAAIASDNSVLGTWRAVNPTPDVSGTSTWTFEGTPQGGLVRIQFEGSSSGCVVSGSGSTQWALTSADRIHFDGYRSNTTLSGCAEARTYMNDFPAFTVRFSRAGLTLTFYAETDGGTQEITLIRAQR